MDAAFDRLYGFDLLRHDDVESATRIPGAKHERFGDCPTLVAIRQRQVVVGRPADGGPQPRQVLAGARIGPCQRFPLVIPYLEEVLVLTGAVLRHEFRNALAARMIGDVGGHGAQATQQFLIEVRIELLADQKVQREELDAKHRNQAGDQAEREPPTQRLARALN